MSNYLLNCSLELGKRYIELNSIKFLTVERHHLGEPGFQLWQMSSESIGLPTDYRLKRDALADARTISKRFNLPIE